MYKEEFFSGYCRQIDGSRMVAAELEDGELSADCCFGNCPYEDRCTIAASLREFANP
jgi:hypothetical protein